ncbi:MAG: HAD family hydrolase [Crenarchaeota archaeon]|nr:HAD family hydrolase [Thermoproteota archaeon]
MRNVEAVSLDVTGTLVDGRSVKRFWDHLIPAVYASENGISFNEAYTRVKKKYSTVSRDDVRWYLPEYWVKELNISISLEKLLEEFRHGIAFFPDVAPTITRLSSQYVLIVSSNLPSVLLQTILEDVKEHFSRVFSSVSTYCLPYKTAEFYAKACSETGFHPEEFLHVGDSKTYDFLVPRIIGMRSMLVKRYINPKQHYEVDSLDKIFSNVA